jgi:hypothetical protein
MTNDISHASTNSGAKFNAYKKLPQNDKGPTLANSGGVAQVSPEKAFQFANTVNPQTQKDLDRYIASADDLFKDASTGIKNLKKDSSYLLDAFRDALSKQYDNAANMLGEGYYGFKAGTLDAILKASGVKNEVITAIKKEEKLNAVEKWFTGKVRTAYAFAQLAIYASNSRS